MDWIKNLMAKTIGKQSAEGFTYSKTKLTAIIYVAVIGIQEISKAWGHPVVIPEVVFRFLEGAGLWSLRDAMGKEVPKG